MIIELKCKKKYFKLMKLIELNNDIKFNNDSSSSCE